jgi:NADH:ubiquinone oxidoreductase subunit C
MNLSVISALLLSRKVFYFYIWKYRITQNRDVRVVISRKVLFFFIIILQKFYLYSAALCVDIVAVDQPNKYFRFVLTYIFLSLSFNTRVLISLFTNELCGAPTLSKLIAGAAWSEREVWDLYGVFFLQHSDLRRLLTDYGFIGHPLRKDFPLTGFSEISFSDLEKRVQLTAVELTQAYRKFRVGVLQQ